MQKVFTLGILLILFSVTIVCEDLAGAVSPENSKNKLTAPTQAANESNYLNMTNTIWRFYNNDMNYSSKILDEYVKKNISQRDAFDATISVFVLNYQTTKVMGQVKPPERYSEYHNNTIRSLIAFQEYLLNMARFYETGDKNYVKSANSLFGESNRYHDKAIVARLP